MDRSQTADGPHAMTIDVDLVSPMVDEAASSVYRRFRRHINRDDLTQEMWTWACAHPDTVDRLSAIGKGGYLTRRLRTVGERWARKEKAAKGGYRPEDEAFYSLRSLREMLPDALDPGATPPQAQQEVSVASSRDGYGSYEAGLADVRAGLAKLDPEDRQLLWFHYRFGFSTDALGTYYRVSTDMIYKRLGRALRRLQARLGGPNPH